MGNYSVSEYSEDASGDGGGGFSTNNFDRADIQERFDEVGESGGSVAESLDSIQEEFDLSDSTMESMEEIRVGDDVDTDDAVMMLEEAGRARAVGDMTDAQLERMIITAEETDGDLEGQVAMRVNRNNTPYAGEPQFVNVAEDGMDRDQARRLTQQEAFAANGIVDSNHEVAEQARADASDPDMSFDEFVEKYDADDLKMEVGNENMAQGHMVERMEAANEAIDEFFQDESPLAGARTNQKEGISSVSDFDKTVTVEAGAGSSSAVSDWEEADDATGTNVWNKAGDSYKAVVDSRGEEELSAATRRQVDVLHAASQDLDVVEDSSWDADGAVFDEDNLTQEAVEEWAGSKYGNAGLGAGSSPELVEDVRDWAEETLPQN